MNLIRQIWYGQRPLKEMIWFWFVGGTLLLDLADLSYRDFVAHRAPGAISLWAGLVLLPFKFCVCVGVWRSTKNAWNPRGPFVWYLRYLWWCFIFGQVFARL